MERIILFMRNRESAFVFRRRLQSEVLWEFLTARKQKLWISLLSDAYNYNIDAYVYNV